MKRVTKKQKCHQLLCVITSYSIHYTKLYENSLMSLMWSALDVMSPILDKLLKIGSNEGVRSLCMSKFDEILPFAYFAIGASLPTVRKFFAKVWISISAKLYPRITSYNVCYTKLLRMWLPGGLSQGRKSLWHHGRISQDQVIVKP